MKSLGLLFIGFIFFLSANAQNKIIVFVCEHGSAKSVIAASYFNELAKEKGLSWEAIARGTNPDKEISPKTKTLLIQDSLFDKSFVPQKLSQQDVDGAQQVFLFFALPESIQGDNKTRNWLEIQSRGDNYQKLRDDILSRITPLIDSLAKQ